MNVAVPTAHAKHRTPMLTSVLAKTVRDQARALWFWALGVAATAGLYVAFWPSFSKNAVYSKMMGQLPRAYRDFLTAGGTIDLGTPAGYLNTELFSFLAPLLLLVYAVAAGANAVAGEEERRTLDLLLANPISRTRVLLEKTGAMVAGSVLIGAALWAALWAGSAAADMGLAPGRLAAATVASVVVGVVFGCLALTIGAATGRRGAALGTGIAVAVLTYFVNALAPSVGALRPYRWTSPFYHASGNNPLINGLAWGHILLLLAAGAVLVGVAWAAFRRRDLAA